MGKKWAHHPLKLGVVRLSDHFFGTTIFLVPKNAFPPKNVTRPPLLLPLKPVSFPSFPKDCRHYWELSRSCLEHDLPSGGKFEVHHETFRYIAPLKNQHGTQKWWFLNGKESPNTHFSRGYVSFRELQIPLIEKLMCQWATGCCAPKCFTRRGSISILTVRYSWAGALLEDNCFSIGIAIFQGAMLVCNGEYATLFRNGPMVHNISGFESN